MAGESTLVQCVKALKSARGRETMMTTEHERSLIAVRAIAPIILEAAAKVAEDTVSGGCDPRVTGAMRHHGICIARLIRSLNIEDHPMYKPDQGKCVNCGLPASGHYRGPHFLHCPPEATKWGDEDCTYCPEDDA